MPPKISKDLTTILKYFVMGTLIVTAINILANIVNMPLPALDGIIIFLGFFVFLAMTYSYNGFKFKSPLDLGIMTLIVVGVSFLSLNISAIVPANLGVIHQITVGLLPLLYGMIVAGIIVIVMGLFFLPESRKGKK